MRKSLSMELPRNLLMAFMVSIMCLVFGVHGYDILSVNTAAFVGDPVVLHCTVVGNKTGVWSYVLSTIPYTINEGLSVASQKYFIDHSSAGQYDLVINSTQPVDANTYFCSEGLEKLLFAAVTLVDLQLSTNISSHLKAGDAVILSCNVFFYGSVSPAISITVTDKDKQVITKRAMSLLLNNTSVASIIAVNDTTFGPYYCTVTLLNGTSKTRTMNQTREITTPVKQAVLNTTSGYMTLGDVIKCFAVGYPEPSYYWQGLESDGNWLLIQNGSWLTLTTLGQKEVRCLAFNIVANETHSSTSVTLNVTVINGTEFYRTTVENSFKTSIIFKSNSLTAAEIDALSTTSKAKLKQAVKIGVGIGVGVGIPLLIALNVIIVVCVRHRNKANSQPVHKTETNAKQNGAFVPDSADNRLSMHDVTLFENDLYAGSNTPAPLLNNQPAFNTALKRDNKHAVSDQDLNVYAEIRKSTMDSITVNANNNHTKLPVVMKLNTQKTAAQPVTEPVKPTETSVNGSTGVVTDNSMQDLTLIENSIYRSMAALPAQGTNGPPDEAYATLDETMISA